MDAISHMQAMVPEDFPFGSQIFMQNYDVENVLRSEYLKLS